MSVQDQIQNQLTVIFCNSNTRIFQIFHYLIAWTHQKKEEYFELNWHNEILCLERDTKRENLKGKLSKKSLCLQMVNPLCDNTNCSLINAVDSPKHCVSMAVATAMQYSMVTMDPASLS